jgi:hypothetical protein
MVRTKKVFFLNKRTGPPAITQLEIAATSSGRRRTRLLLRRRRRRSEEDEEKTLKTVTNQR